MYQKSVVVVLSVIGIALFLIVVLYEKQPQETYTDVQNPVMDAGVKESESINRGVPDSSTGMEAEVAPQMPQGKINVQVACESALMYTTFTDGQSADVFIDECVEGKHPEVIERYINDMGVDGAVI